MNLDQIEQDLDTALKHLKRNAKIRSLEFAQGLIGDDGMVGANSSKELIKNADEIYKYIVGERDEKA